MKTAARILLTLILVAAGCVGGYELWDYYMFSPWTRDARVQADVVSIAPDVSGFVDEVRVKDNQFVHKGDILVILDRERYSRALATAAANVAALKAQMDMRQHEAAPLQPHGHHPPHLWALGHERPVPAAGGVVRRQADHLLAQHPRHPPGHRNR